MIFEKKILPHPYEKHQEIIFSLEIIFPQYNGYHFPIYQSLPLQKSKIQTHFPVMSLRWVSILLRQQTDNSSDLVMVTRRCQMLNNPFQLHKINKHQYINFEKTQIPKTGGEKAQLWKNQNKPKSQKMKTKNKNSSKPH